MANGYPTLAYMLLKNHSFRSSYGRNWREIAKKGKNENQESDKGFFLRKSPESLS